jgi:hypothetical protein
VTITITKSGASSSYDVESEGATRRLSLKVSTPTMSVVIPDEDNPDVMSIGGTKQTLTIEWVISENTQVDFYTKINTVMTYFGSGEMGVKYTIYIDFWNFNRTGVITRFDIVQNEGEGYIATISAEFEMGNVIELTTG